MRTSIVFAALVLASAVASASEQQRIVSLGGSTTEILYAMGLGDQLVGVDDSSTYPSEAQKVAKVGYYRSVGAEGVLSLKPTLVLASAESGPPPALAQIRSAGVRVEVLPSAMSIEESKARIIAIAKAVGRVEAGEKLTSLIDADMSQLEEIDLKKKPRVLVLFGHGRGALQVAGKKTAADAMLQLAGAINVATGHENYRPLSAEAVLASKPDVILTTRGALASGGGEASVWALPGVALTPAGKANRLVVLDDLYLLGFGHRVGAAVVELAGALR